MALLPSLQTHKTIPPEMILRSAIIIIASRL